MYEWIVLIVLLVLLLPNDIVILAGSYDLFKVSSTAQKLTEVMPIWQLPGALDIMLNLAAGPEHKVLCISQSFWLFFALMRRDFSGTDGEPPASALKALN